MVWRASVRDVIYKVTLFRLDVLQYIEKCDSRPDSEQCVELPNTFFIPILLLKPNKFTKKILKLRKTKHDWYRTGPKYYNLIDRKTFSGGIERRTEIVMINHAVASSTWFKDVVVHKTRAPELSREAQMKSPLRAPPPC